MVIVVIGIIASISLVSYAGAQERARNAQILSSLNQWEKILNLYEASTGTYPKGNLDYVCLGDVFSVDSPYAENQCMKALTWGVSVDSSMMSLVKNEVQYSYPVNSLPSLTFINMSGES